MRWSWALVVVVATVLASACSSSSVACGPAHPVASLERIDPRTGRVEWRTTVDWPGSWPTDARAANLGRTIGVAAGRVVTAGEYSVAGWDERSGRRVWQIDVADGVDGVGTTRGEVVIASRRESTSFETRVDARSGRLRSRHSVAHAVSVLDVAAGQLVAGGTRLERTGAGRAATVDAPRSRSGLVPFADDGRFAYYSDGQVVVVVDFAVPRVVRVIANAIAVPPIVPGRLLVASGAGAVSLIDVATGRYVVRRSGPFAGLSGAAAVAVGGSYAVVAGCCGGATSLVVLDGATGAVVRRGPVDPPTGMWAVDGEHVLFDDAGSIRVEDVATRTTVWDGQLARRVQATTRADGALFVLAADPVAYCA